MMWLLFYLRASIVACALYIPGFVCLSRLRVPTFLVVAIAPAVSIISLTIMMAGFYAFHIALAWPFYLLPLIFESLIGLRVNGTWIRRRLVELKEEGRLAALYIFAALILVTFVYVKTLDGPASIVPLFDNANTISEVRCYVDTNLYGPIFSSYYLDSPSLDQGSSYYPSVFHSLAALVASSTLCSPAEAINIVVFVGLCPILSLSTWSFIKACFPENRLVELSGVFTSVAFVAYPWNFIIFGPLLTNLFSLTLLPAFVATVIIALSHDRWGRSSGWVMAALCAIALALMHPGAIFSAAVICIPFILHKVRLLSLNRNASKVHSIAAVVIAVLAICVIWCGCYQLPFLQGLVSFTWRASMHLSEAISKVATLAFSDCPSQLVVAALVCIGCLACLRRGEEVSWLIGSALLGAVLYCVDVTMDGELKQLLTGFWYTDSRRVASLVTIPLMPLFAYGCSRVLETCRNFVVCKADSVVSIRAVTTFVLLVFGALIFGPTFVVAGGPTFESSFSFVRRSLTSLNDLEANPLMDGSEEDVMLDKAEVSAGFEIKEIIGDDDSVVLNNALDGSAFLYGLCDIKTLYRSCLEQSPDEPYELLRLHVDSYVTNPEVRKALKEKNIKYVVQLDSGRSPSPISTFYWSYKPEFWTGIQSINSNTPGFELVYQRDDIRLYRLTDL